MPLQMTIVERVTLQRRIAEERAKPRPPSFASIAKREHIAESTARKLHGEWSEIHKVLDAPIEVVEEAIDTFTEMIRRLAEIEPASGR